jgi:hypothetical protein
LAAAPAATRGSFRTDLSSALKAASNSTTTKTQKAKRSIFDHWTEFCEEHSVSVSLSDIPSQEDKLCYLLVFGYRYRAFGLTGKPVRADSVGKALQAVGEGITHLGLPDPRVQAGGVKLLPLLASFLKALRDEDDPATRAYPCNITIIRSLLQALDTGDARLGSFNAHIINLIIVRAARPAREEPDSTPTLIAPTTLTPTYPHTHTTNTAQGPHTTPNENPAELCRTRHTPGHQYISL